MAGTLEQLWLSYNQIERLDNLAPLQKLHTLFISNNRIKSWDEVAKCSQLSDIKHILLLGNAIYADRTKQECWPDVVKRIPQIEIVDGAIVTAALRASAEELE